MDDGDTAMAFCPHCGEEVYEFSEKCPHCGDWITPTYRSPRSQSRRRIVVTVIVALIILALLMWAF